MSRLNLLCNGPEVLYKPLPNRIIYRPLLFGLVAYLAAYTLLLFINLDLMPLAWVDEIAGLEPAVNFSKRLGYISKLWPYEGSDSLFLAYLPLQGWLHIVAIKILGLSMYTIRLPYALFLLGTGFVFFRTLRFRNIDLLFAIVLTVLLLNEKALFETARGVRVEPIATLLISLSFFSIYQNRRFLASIFIALLLVLHPYVWPFCLAVFIYLCVTNSGEHKFSLRWFIPNVYWIPILAVLIGYLFFINFQFDLFYSQFMAQARMHSASPSILNRIYDHVIERFWPYYTTQPYIPIIIYIAFIRSGVMLLRKKGRLEDYVLIVSHICWLVALSPVHRYNCILTLLSLYSLIPVIQQYTVTKRSLVTLSISLVVVGISIVDPLSRQLLAFSQKKVRNPDRFLSWVEETKPQGKSIISGHEVAYYLSVSNEDLDFFLFNTTPYRFDFEDYSNLLIISEIKDTTGIILGQYQPSEVALPSWTKFIKSKTYDQLYLIKYKSVLDYNEALASMKSLNTKINNQRKYN